MTSWDYAEIARALENIAKAINNLAEANIHAAKIQATENPNLARSLTPR